jgi:crotonobetainyl-CoA:carnitine CoA-transferase CaiB-like acyl-CoA transferase
MGSDFVSWDYERDESGNGPLAGLIVVEIGQYIAAPYAGVVLADLGARVIKVEPPHGDGIRSWGPFVGDESAPFMAYNRGKECVTADLRDPDDRALVEALVSNADIVIENNRPGVLEQFGLDANAVRTSHPHVIYCSITGYGTDSPYSERPGFDLVIQGVTGLMSVTGDADADLAKIPVPIVDGTASLHATTAILAAVRRRDATGVGATIDISLQASTATWMMLLGAGYFASGEAPRRLGSAHPFAAPYQAFATGDLPMTIAVGNERQWQRFCSVLGLQELEQDERFAVNEQRALRQVELAEIVTERLCSRPRAYWIEALSDAGVPCGPVNDLPEALGDPALMERGMIVSFEHPSAGAVRTIGNPIRWDGRTELPRRSPLKGEHTDRIAAEFLVHHDANLVGDDGDEPYTA